MTTYEARLRVAADGVLHVRLPPELADIDVRVTVEPASNGAAHNLAEGRPRTPEEWRAFAESTAGSIPDFPDVERPGPDSYERRDW